MFLLFKVDPTSDVAARRVMLDRATQFYRAGGAPTMSEWASLSDAERQLMVEARNEVDAVRQLRDASMMQNPAQAQADAAAILASRVPNPNLAREAFARAEAELMARAGVADAHDLAAPVEFEGVDDGSETPAL